MTRPWKAVIVTGDRHAEEFPVSRATWMETIYHVFRIRFDKYVGNVLIHGGCKGIDLIADQVAKEVNPERFSKILPFPISEDEWKLYGRKAGPMRNRDMLKALVAYGREPMCSIEVLAFHDNIRRSRGTRDMVRQARAANVPVLIYDKMGERYEWSE